MSRLFGTDGVRGVANKDLTAELAFKLGKAGATVLKKESGRPVFIIGKDTRISGDMLDNALAAGILSCGGNVIDVGIIPTPAVAYLVRYYHADAGVVISASHNPFEYNGIKFFNSEGFKLADSIEDEIESRIVNETWETAEPDKLGKLLEAGEDAEQLYEEYLLSTIDIRLDGIKVVLDCANGASYRVTPAVYRKLGADVTVIGGDPDGVNINRNIGSTHPEALQKKVVEEHADLGLAFDGDADRLIVVDEKGGIIDGDQTICLCAKMLKEKGKLKENKVTGTVMSNLGFRKFVEDMGADVEITAVGDRYVLESMLKTGSVIGGEQSGHIIFLDYSTTGDGAISSLQFIKAWRASGMTASDFGKQVKLYPQVLVNAEVKNENKEKFRDDEEIAAVIEEYDRKMAGDGRVLIRPSGTEPLVRVMIEGSDESEIFDMANSLADLISKKFS
jgi:phosphoglucosamine mutase